MKSLTIFLALSLPAFANLGEKYEDFTRRVGTTTRIKPQDSDGVMTAIHTQGQVEVMVTAVNGVIKSERHTPCSLEEAKAILAAQTVGTFDIALRGEITTLWQTKDLQYAATYDAKRKSFTVWSNVMNEIISKKAQRAKEAK